MADIHDVGAARCSLIRLGNTMENLLGNFLGTPVWMWASFLLGVFVLLALDLGILNKKSEQMSVAKSLKLSAFYIALGLGFGIFVWQQLGSESAFLYVTGFVVEKSLAIDNVFVIAMIFAAFNIPTQYQHRVLFWGILGVILLRAIMIGFGAAIVENYSWVLYVFAAFLVFTGVKMLQAGDAGHNLEDNKLLSFVRERLKFSDKLDGAKFFTKVKSEDGKLKSVATPLFAALILVELADLIFAIDSIPAIFAITTDPFIVFTSNIFAILGLRALYFALAAMIERFKYLKVALAVLLIFIGSKIFIADWIGLTKFPPLVSLTITFTILASGVFYSLYRTRTKVAH